MPVVADYVVVMARGRIGAEGPPTSVVQKIFGDNSYKVVVRPYTGNDRGAVIKLARELGAKAVQVGDTVIVYTSNPDVFVGILTNMRTRVEVAPVGIGDVVLALGELDEG
jgi:ABC-type glutathione transport system ATPase component